jgi:hypothetical protein
VNNLNDGDKGQNQELRNACLRAGQVLRERLLAVKTALGNSVPYPFDHAEEALSVGRHALLVVPDPEAIGDLVQASNDVYSKLTTLQRRVLGRLAVTAEEVEGTLGMKPVEVEEQATPESLSTSS